MIDFSVDAFAVNESIDIKKIKEKVIKIFGKLMELFDKAREKVLKIIEKFFGKNKEKMTALEKAYNEYKTDPGKYESTLKVTVFNKPIMDLDHVTGVADKGLDIMDKVVDSLKNNTEYNGIDALESLVKAEYNGSLISKRAGASINRIDILCNQFYVKERRVDLAEAIKAECFSNITEKAGKDYSTKLSTWYKAANDRAGKIVDQLRKLNVTDDLDMPLFTETFLTSIYTIVFSPMAFANEYITAMIQVLQGCYIAVRGSENGAPMPDIK